jgi:hypothetical protein
MHSIKSGHAGLEIFHPHFKNQKSKVRVLFITVRQLSSLSTFSENVYLEEVLR